jgi:hypothetical protein
MFFNIKLTKNCSFFKTLSVPTKLQVESVYRYCVQEVVLYPRQKKLGGILLIIRITCIIKVQSAFKDTEFFKYGESGL